MPNHQADSFQIRPATVGDVAAMFQVRLAVTENRMTLDELAAASVTPESIAEAIRSASCAWVATIDGEVAGFAMVDLDSACLFALFVRSDREGRGLGTALCRTCEQALLAQHEAAWLETATTSRAARLYRHLGWGDERDVGDGDIRLTKRRS
ncbi:MULTISPECIES: GNAT family N-acetyltransferase [unclassified Comamonas]|uniref:GNAT family N-acetyltransferase n=1 Tax=unclassified Comamonas TaxID=2638500 RepID=UPI000395D3AB|nr:GNAT family N-acetyltransferase [Comamonas sp. B-9]